MIDPLRFRELQKTVRQLSNSHVRRATELAWIEGPRALIHAVDFQRRIHTVVVSERLLKPVVAKLIVHRLRRGGTNVAFVSPEQFRSLSRTVRASGIGLLLHQHWTPLEQLQVAAGLFYLAVSHIRSPGNLGTMIRTAQAAGATGVILIDYRIDPFDSTVLRSSMGSILATTLTRTTLPSLIAWSQSRQVSLVGTSPHGVESYTAALPRPAVLLFGEEREGLTNAELEACTMSVRIPMHPGTDSINVAVAAGVVLFELRRQITER